MSDQMQAVALGGFFTLLGGAMAAILSALFSGRAYREQRRERQSKEQRDYIIEVLDAGRDWAAGLDTVALALGTVPDTRELSQMDAWKGQQARVARYTRALNAADLMLLEDGLHRRAKLLRHHLAMQTDYTERILTEAQTHRRATNEALEALWTYCDEHRAELDKFVKAARSTLV